MTDAETLNVLEDARYVAEDSLQIVIDEQALVDIAIQFKNKTITIPEWNAELHFTDLASDHVGQTLNYLLILDALNFSFWANPESDRWKINYKGQVLRGYWALAASLKRAIEEGIPLTDASYMANCTAEQLAHILRGENHIPLLSNRLQHLNEIGQVLLDHFDGEFKHVVVQANGSAIKLLELILTYFPNFRDEAVYKGRNVQILKRAQILPADIYGAFKGQGLGAFYDIDKLTAFADYKVPQVLEHLGILKYSDELNHLLANRIEIPRNSELEIELRAATVWGCERLRQALEDQGRSLTNIEIDWILWEAGLHLPADAKNYHLTRTTCY
jgi:hypothetical protein